MDPPPVAGLPVEESVKFLGLWWCSNSSSRKSVEEHICKARRAFFANGDLGAFHSLLNPFSSRSLVESCVIPVLMFGAEAWYCNASLLLRLESFQSEIGKKILKACLHWTHYLDQIRINPLPSCPNCTLIVPNQIRSGSISIHFRR